jgi:hypothetical protein
MNQLTLIITPMPSGLTLPTLDKLIKKASPQPLDNTLPIAALTGLHYGFDTRQGYWLRADPIDLRADINSAYFFGQQCLKLDLAHAQKLADSIKPLLVDLDIELFVPDPYCWFLKLKTPISLNTPPPHTMLGCSIRDYLTEAEPWVRRLFTEIQMLLAPVATKKIGERLVTGLWLWGGGELPATKDNEVLMIHPDEDSEDKHLKPIYKALKQKKINELMIYTGGEQMHHLTSKQLSWWRNLI